MLNASTAKKCKYPPNNQMIGNENSAILNLLQRISWNDSVLFTSFHSIQITQNLHVDILCNAKRKKKNLSNDDVNSNKDSSVSGMMCMRKRVRVDLGNRVKKYVILFSNADYSQSHLTQPPLLSFSYWNIYFIHANCVNKNLPQPLVRTYKLKHIFCNVKMVVISLLSKLWIMH